MGNDALKPALKCFEPVLGMLPGAPAQPIQNNLITLFLDCDARKPNQTLPLEKKAYRLIASEISGHFRKYGFAVRTYTNEEDLVSDAKLPPARTLVLLSHDWPTVHEDPVWMGRFWKMIESHQVVVPTKEQLYFVFRKTTYLRALLANGCVRLQPTYCVDDSTDLAQLAREVVKMAANERKFVIKENFSAGKEGVSFVDFQDERQVLTSLESTRARLVIQA
jgi:hypothetical protein